MAGFLGLGNDVGGYAEGPMPVTGNAGVPQTGVTWEQMLAAFANSSGNKQQSPLNLMPQTNPVQNQGIPLYTPPAQFQPIDEQQKQSSVGEISQYAALIAALI